MDKIFFNSKLLPYYMDCGQAVLGKKLFVKEGTCNPGEIGWTGMDRNVGVIYVNYKHEILDSLDYDRQIIVLTGVFCHELMHQCFSDFDCLTYGLEKYKKTDKLKFMLLKKINNIVEDSAIEYMARFKVGGTLLKSLYFAIQYFYDMNKTIEDADDPITQLFNAYIIYGDMGIIKGEFTFPEARTAFENTLPLFSEAITEPDAYKRFDAAEKITDIVKSMFPDENTDDGENDQKPNGGPGSDTGNNQGSYFSGSRDDIIDQVEGIIERFEDDRSMNGQGAEPKGHGEAKIKMKKSDLRDSSATKNSFSRHRNEQIMENRENTMTRFNSKESSKEDKNTPDPKTSTDISTKPSISCDNSDDKAEKSRVQEGECKQEDKVMDDSVTDMHSDRCSITDDETIQETENNNPVEYGQETCNTDIYELTEDDIKSIVEEIKKCAEISGYAESSEHNVDYFSKKATVAHYNVEVDNRIIQFGDNIDKLSIMYDDLRQTLSPQISSLYSSLLKIFRMDEEEKNYSMSGNVSYKRLSSGVQTARIFERRISPKDKNNMKVLVLVDESGSMDRSDKALNAKMSAIVLAEVFGKLRIPYSVIGFTTNYNCKKVVQNHYLHWDNTKENRLKLLNISAYNYNFDAYSIRYATEMMKKKKTKYNILIVISDGVPSMGIGSKEEMYADTAGAIAMAKKTLGNVIGIGLGRIDLKVFEGFYGKDFVHVKNINELSTEMSHIIRQTVRKW